MRKFRFRLPEFDVPGLWVLSLGIWFHIISRLVRREPEMAILLAQIIGVSMVLWGATALSTAGLMLPVRPKRPVMPEDADMNLRHTVFTVALMTLSLATQASTMDEIKSLWHPQGRERRDLCQHPRKTLKLSHFRRSSRSGTASAMAARSIWPTGRSCCLCRDTARTATSLIRS